LEARIWKWPTDQLVFLALARAAGFELTPFTYPRAASIFSPADDEFESIDGDVGAGKVNGKDVYCDPATAFAPFGFFRGLETGVRGLRLDKNGGSG